MVAKRLNDGIKKNLLDLEYNKYLQYYNTSIILLFTYLIGTSIAFITKQIDHADPKQLLLVSLIYIGFIGIVIIFMLNFKEHLNNIPKEINKLKL